MTELSKEDLCRKKLAILITTFVDNEAGTDKDVYLKSPQYALLRKQNSKKLRLYYIKHMSMLQL